MKVTERSLKQRKAKDISRDSIAYLFSLFGVLILALIIFFVFDKGHEYLSWEFLTSDYYTTNTTVSYGNSTSAGTFENPNIENVYFLPAGVSDLKMDTTMRRIQSFKSPMSIRTLRSTIS